MTSNKALTPISGTTYLRSLNFTQVEDYYYDSSRHSVVMNGYYGAAWILRSGEAACPAVTEPPVRTDGATRLLSITPVHRGECHRLHALNGLSLDPLPEC